MLRILCNSWIGGSDKINKIKENSGNNRKSIKYLQIYKKSNIFLNTPKQPLRRMLRWRQVSREWTSARCNSLSQLGDWYVSPTVDGPRKCWEVFGNLKNSSWEFDGILTNTWIMEIYRIEENQNNTIIKFLNMPNQESRRKSKEVSGSPRKSEEIFRSHSNLENSW